MFYKVLVDVLSAARDAFHVSIEYVYATGIQFLNSVHVYVYMHYFYNERASSEISDLVDRSSKAAVVLPSSGTL